jgi:peptidyl-prolyl cis-trans isomerase B (cyclophilin B)
MQRFSARVHSIVGLILAALLSSLTCACGDSTPRVENRKLVDPVFVSEDVPDERLGDYHVQLGFEIDGKQIGHLTIRLWPDLAPKTVRNFLSIAESGFYEGLTMHRVMRQFMVQGGCENGNGSGSGPLFPIPGEFSDTEATRHVYGTISMARGNDPDSAGAQFFVVCDDGPPAWSLDGKYASFGQVVDGASVLEAIANVPVEMGPQGERSRPTQRIEISVLVVRGELALTEPIAPSIRKQDVMGWPNTVEVQTLLVGVGGGILPVERTLEQAKELSQALFERAKNGEDFDSLVREYSDDPVQKGMGSPVGYRFANEGSFPKEGQRAVNEMVAEFQAKFDQLGELKRQGQLTSAQVATQARQLQVDIERRIRVQSTTPRAQRRALADRAFGLEVGEIQWIPRDPARTLKGFYLMRRIR